jgi:hypothetical protein
MGNKYQSLIMRNTIPLSQKSITVSFNPPVLLYIELYHIEGNTFDSIRMVLPDGINKISSCIN